MNPKRAKRGRPRGTKKHGERRFLKEEEIRAFFKVAKKSKRDDLMFSLALYLGLRAGEIRGLKFEQINEDSREITIRGLKSGRQRTYELPERIWKKYKAWMKVYPGGNGKFFFPHRLYKDEPMSIEGVKRAFKRVAQKAGLNGDVSVHNLRHTCSIELVKRGESPYVVQRWLRHKKLSSSEVYFEMFEDREADTRAKEYFGNYF